MPRAERVRAWYVVLVVSMILAFVVPMSTVQRVQASTIPTTSNPTINTANGGVRTMQNVSFEEFGICTGAPTSYHVIRQEEMGGWFTTQPKFPDITYQERCNGVNQGSADYRVIELQSASSRGYTPEDGDVFAELNAYNAGMLYQPLCVRNDEVFEFSFAHRPVGDRKDVAAFRIGIPSGLDAGSTPQDTYSREILRVETTQASNIVTTVLQTTSAGTTANTAVISTNKWGVYSGTHRLPSTGYDGVRNVGFVGIEGASPDGGNLLDDIRLGLEPIIDLGTTRDRSANEGATATSINIRINGRVATGTKIVIEQNAGTATPDSDFTFGTVTAGKYGNASVVHTSGSSTWTITVPPGDYDGGIVARSRAGGLTIPVTYRTDGQSEGDEWAKFNLKNPGVGGATTNWMFDDPTCDGSFKSDGAVYTIRNVAPTATPITPSATFTASPTNTFTPTPHPFAIRDVAVGSAFTLVVLNNSTLATWGFNREGQASLPSWMKGRPVSEVETGSNYAVVLGANGRVFGWGQDDFGTLAKFPAGCTTKCMPGTGIPAGALSGVRTISASLGHVMAIKTDGSLLIWGRNDFKQREAPTTARTGLTAIAAGHSHSLVVKNGRVQAWGRNTWGQVNVPANLTGVTAVSAGFDHSLALKSDGTVVCWGSNHTGQCSVPRGLTNVIQISAGRYYSLAMDRNGKVYGWGTVEFNQSRVPNDLPPAGAISSGYSHSIIGFRNGEVLAWGDSKLSALVSRTPTVTP